jgi:hypothetical protein
VSDFETEGFNLRISRRDGTYIVGVWRREEMLELEIEEPSAKKTEYYCSADKLISRERAGELAYHIESLRWTMERPILEVVSQEIQKVGAEAIEAYLQYERTGK